MDDIENVQNGIDEDDLEDFSGGVGCITPPDMRPLPHS